MTIKELDSVLNGNSLVAFKCVEDFNAFANALKVLFDVLVCCEYQVCHKSYVVYRNCFVITIKEIGRNVIEFKAT